MRNENGSIGNTYIKVITELKRTTLYYTGCYTLLNFELCLSFIYSKFDNKCHIDRRGLAVGSPLSPLFAEIFMLD